MTKPTPAGRLCKTALALSLLLVTSAALALPEHPSETRRRKRAERAEAARLERPPSVGGVTWRGNRALPASELQAVSFTRPPDWRPWRLAPEFSESTLIGDMSRIESLYKLHGYYQTTASYELVWNPDQSIVAITILIDEGPGVSLAERTIELSSSGSMSPEEVDRLYAKLPIEVGEPFSAKRYAEAKEILLDRLANSGHPIATIRGGATVDAATDEAIVTWVIDPGPAVYFGDVTINGLYLVKEETARREVLLKKGDRYSTKALVDTRLRMQRQGLFSWVNIKAQPKSSPTPDADMAVVATAEGGVAPVVGGSEAETEDDAGEQAEEDLADGEGVAEPPTSVVWPVQIHVTERKPHTIDAGIGYSSDESFRAQVGWRNGNFLGNARKLRIQGVYSGILSKAEIEFTQPYLFGSKTALLIKSSIRYETEPGFTANRLLNSIGVSRPFAKSWRGRVTYEHSYQDVTRTALGVFFFLDEPLGRSKVGTLEFGLRRQTLDNLLNPTRGTWFDFVVAPTLRELGSDFDYMTYLFEARAFYTFFEKHVIAARFRIGAIQPIRGTTNTQVPLVGRFYLGGANSHRGFRYHELPPNRTLAFRAGGLSSLEASIEWRFPIWKKLGGVVFLDAATLDLEPFTYPMDELFWAAGPGVRYDTIVGPLRFDFGILLNPKNQTNDRYQWFISVGQSF
jgi:outer membrane protein assembly factor BamA